MSAEIIGPSGCMADIGVGGELRPSFGAKNARGRGKKLEMLMPVPDAPGSVTRPFAAFRAHPKGR
jgi:hypothetical protein